MEITLKQTKKRNSLVSPGRRKQDFPTSGVQDVFYFKVSWGTTDESYVWPEAYQ